jgi:N-acetylglucosaminyldiphosphoundecaprenol N-acetyl-beta-D-mannosaminyltransferase
MTPQLAQLPPTVEVGGLSLHPMSFDDTVDWICERAVNGSGGTVCTPNADYVVRARRDSTFRDAILSCDVRVPDGMAVVYAARLAGLPIARTVTGRLLLPSVAARAATEGWPIAIYGSRGGVAADAARRLAERSPGLTVGAAIAPPMPLEVGGSLDEAAVATIRSSGARVVFVALGAPKQETWIARHRDALPGAVLVGIGAGVDIVAGRFREAPPWMTRIGAEWLFRLAQEPRRLARRYLVEDPWIFGWALRTRFARRPG